MRRKSFEEMVEQMLASGCKYRREVYYFVKEILDYTIDLAKQDNGGKRRHVSGQELLRGFRSYSLKEFGPMTFTVLREWDIHRCEDIGDVVFELIERGVFGRDSSDSIEDFASVFEFEEVFLNPFIPTNR